jgi:hypothetical protein
MPNGVHETTAREVEQRLVQAFPASMTRRELHSGWRDRREEIADLIAIESEWVDGSFVSSKRDPGDVDVVTFVDGTVYDNLPTGETKRLDELFLRVRTKLRLGCDGFVVPVRQPGHLLRPVYEAQLLYWHRTWSHDRDGREKGFLDVKGDP